MVVLVVFDGDFVELIGGMVVDVDDFGYGFFLGWRGWVGWVDVLLII